jgi:hypothetical protein
VTNADEFHEVARAAREPAAGVDFASLAVDDPLLLDPTRW